MQTLLRQLTYVGSDLMTEKWSVMEMDGRQNLPFKPFNTTRL
ncbi:MAG: hypothetical protein N3B10_08555 [Armatimonadetes bacterium]|nr:hypothetical protein [Armatimonadota bacterium]MCX7968524.1 hypothetical protein [Armatimonadota bacterium]MDW8143027.1 hypothetical protein [Armatimonadota bacterium]